MRRFFYRFEKYNLSAAGPVPSEGLEPPTGRVEDACSNPLSYEGNNTKNRKHDRPAAVFVCGAMIFCASSPSLSP